MLIRLAPYISALALTVSATVLTAQSAPPAPGTTPAATKSAPAKEPRELSAADFARLPFVDSIVLSPSGNYFAGLMAVQGQQVISVMNLFNRAEKPPLLTVPEGTEARWIRWVNDENILIGLTALLPIESERWYVSRTVAMNRITGKLTKLGWDLNGQGSDVIWIPRDGSNQILLSAQASVYLGNDFWPRVYRVDVTTGRKVKVVDDQPDILDWSADATGRVRIGTGYEDRSRAFKLIYRNETDFVFRTIDRVNSKDDEYLINPLLFLPGTNNALAIHEGDDGVAAIREIDLMTRAPVKTFYSPPAGTDVRGARLSPDGTQVLGVVTSDDEAKVRWLDPVLAELQSSFDKALPDRNVQILSFSNDRARMLVRVDRPDSPGSIYFFDKNDPKLQRLAVINEAVGTRPLNPVKKVRYKARDGLEIEAILTLPKHKVGKNLPVVVLPHGGPWAHDTLSYDYWAQFVASRGYAVIQPNFRGSTGYGKEFVDAGKGQMGLKMQDDVSDALHWLTKEGIGDPKRACIMGASYGGYAAMWGVAREPDLFRCAISIAGVANLRREFNDFGNALMAKEYKDGWKAMTPDFAAVSPINAIARIKTPMLLVHGKKDVTVDVGQSDAMYNKMRAAGKQVDYLPLSEADHYFTRQADREALLVAIEQFLAKHNPAD